MTDDQKDAMGVHRDAELIGAEDMQVGDFVYLLPIYAREIKSIIAESPDSDWLIVEAYAPNSDKQIAGKWRIHKHQTVERRMRQEA